MDIKIHRGAREIGGVCIEVRERGTRVIMDIGLPIVAKDSGKFNIREYRHLAVPELLEKGILPKVDGLYGGEKTSIAALLISHSHLDHYGLYSYIDQKIPCYLGIGTRKLIELNNLFTKPKTNINYFHDIKSGFPFEIGPFTITPFLMDHSAFDSYAFLIESARKKIIYSGDFRNHGRKAKSFKKFIEIAPKNVDALLLEGTTIGRESIVPISEQELENHLINAFKNESNIVLAILSGQNIDRLVSFYKAAIKSKRHFVIDVYTAAVLYTLKDLAKIPFPSRRFPNLRVIYTKKLCDRLVEAGLKELLFTFKPNKIEWDEILTNPEKMVLLARGSMASEIRKRPELADGTVVYSMWEGYLKEDSLKSMIDMLRKRGFDFRQLHSSGHACSNTLKATVDALKPKKVIPVHTFYPKKYEEFLSGNVKISKDAEIINL